jgi:signal recognition particle subunit SRP54
VPADVYRPAAIEQLVRVGGSVGLACLAHDGSRKPADLARTGMAEAAPLRLRHRADRHRRTLHIDEPLMDELRTLKDVLAPTEILFVADAMTGQDAVRSAGEFHRALGLTGIILTKMDGRRPRRRRAVHPPRHRRPHQVRGDGGASRRVRRLPPRPDGGRILGMGDILGLIEKAEEASTPTMPRTSRRSSGRTAFTLERLPGPAEDRPEDGAALQHRLHAPGMSQVRQADLDEGAVVRVMAILDSMTARERERPGGPERQPEAPDLPGGRARAWPRSTGCSSSSPRCAG